MNVKYYADITLDFSELNYGIICDTQTNKKELIELIKQFATKKNLICDIKTKKFFKEGKEVGHYKITSRTF